MLFVLYVMVLIEICNSCLEFVKMNTKHINLFLRVEVHTELLLTIVNAVTLFLNICC